MIGALRKIPFPRTLAAIAIGIAAYLLLGFLALPRYIERTVPDYVAEKLQRKASIGAVRVNPLLFELEVSDFALTERDGAPIAAFKRLLVDFELSSIARWAWTVAVIRMDGLDLRADIRPDGTLNLAALAETLPRSGEPGDQAPPRLLLQSVVLTDGTITFSDRSGSAPASAALLPLNLELRDFSTLPEHRGQYSLKAKLRDGGTLAWGGEVSLQPLSSHGQVAVSGVKLATAWHFLRDRLDLSEPAGAVDFSARYRASYVDGTPRLHVEDMRVLATGVALSQPGATSPMLTLETVEAKGGRFDLAARELALKSLEVSKGTVAAETDARGAVNWQKVVKVPKAASSGSQTAAAGAPWKIKAEAMRVGGVALRYGDRSRAAPITVTVDKLEAGLAAQVAMGAATQVLVNGLALKLARVVLGETGSPAPLATLDAVALEDGSFDLEMRRFVVQRIGVEGGSVSVVRGSDGRVRALDLLSPADAGRLRREVTASLAGARKEARPWRVSLDALDVARVRVTLADRGFEPAIAYDLDHLRIGLRNMTNDGKMPVKFDAELGVAQGGAVRAAGSIAAGGDRITASVRIDRVALKPLQPLVARHSTLRLETGVVSANAKVEYRAQKGQTQLRAIGGAGIANLLLNEAASGDRLLAWKALDATGVDFSLAPVRLRVADVRIAEAGAKIVVFKDRSLNLVKVLEPQAVAAAESAVAPGRDAPKPPAAGAGAPEPSAPPFDVGVERIRVENGVVDFADLSLVLPFAAKVEALQGTATGVSSDPAGGATLQLEGRVGEFGLARVGGTLKPFHPKSFTDIGVTFRNVEVAQFSPYSATFAGRKIASGRVSLDLRYKIENSQLAGDNKVVLEKFTLGERVESPGALSLPLDLAIALLTDSNGQINVAVPVSGNVDDPKFSYGHLVWQAIFTVIKNIVTAPFRALAALFGGGGESLESIVFDAGRAVLQPPEQEKLRRVAEAIAKRPQLMLVAEGQYGEADRAALRERGVALAIAGKLGRQPAPGSLPEPVNPLDAKTQRAMEALFEERSSAAALSQFATDAVQARGKPVVRVNAVLALAGRGSPDAAFYQAMLKHLNDTAKIPDEAPGQLADARARAVTGYLVEKLSVPAERMAARVAAEPGSERVRLAFDVAPGGRQ